MKDEKRNDEAKKPTPPPATGAKQAHAAGDATAPKPKYVFKIVPADPKNTLDFEDTADK